MLRCTCLCAVLFCTVATADDKKPEPLKVGETVRALPVFPPFPTMGIPLAKSSAQASEVAGIATREKNYYKAWVEMCEANDLPYVRHGSKLKILEVADKGGNVKVELAVGKGKVGYIREDSLRREMMPPKTASKLPEGTRRKLHERYFEALAESFVEAQKAKPNATRWELEEEAGVKFGQKLERESKDYGIKAKEWISVVQQALCDDWPSPLKGKR